VRVVKRIMKVALLNLKKESSVSWVCFSRIFLYVCIFLDL